VVRSKEVLSLSHHNIFEPVLPLPTAELQTPSSSVLEISAARPTLVANELTCSLKPHRCGVTQRWFVSHSSPETKNPDGSMRGRPERGTPETAGHTFPYEPPDDPGGAGSSNGTFLQKACASGNFIAGVLRLADEMRPSSRTARYVSRHRRRGAGHRRGGVALAIGTICLTLAAAVILREITRMPWKSRRRQLTESSAPRSRA
jgi:hypothetical protein